jgi:cytochrome c553
MKLEVNRRANEPRMARPATHALFSVWVATFLAWLAWPAGAGSSADDAAAEIAAAMACSVDVERGRQAYGSCAVCHGADGAGHADGTFPQLAGQHASVIIKQLADIRSGRRENPIMLPYAEQLIDPQQLADVAGYLASLPRPTGHGRGAGTDLGTGARLYGRDCVGCHGVDGEGDAASFIPSLVGQHYGYLLRQIRDIGAGRRGNAHPEMAALVERLNDAELQALVDFAASLGTPSARAASRSAR